MPYETSSFLITGGISLIHLSHACSKETTTDLVDTTGTEQVAEKVTPLFARTATIVIIDNGACTHQVCVCPVSRWSLIAGLDP